MALPHFDSRLPASRSVKQYISVVLSGILFRRPWEMNLPFEIILLIYVFILHPSPQGISSVRPGTVRLCHCSVPGVWISARCTAYAHKVFGPSKSG